MAKTTLTNRIIEKSKKYAVATALAISGLTGGNAQAQNENHSASENDVQSEIQPAQTQKSTSQTEKDLTDKITALRMGKRAESQAQSPDSVNEKTHQPVMNEQAKNGTSENTVTTDTAEDKILLDDENFTITETNVDNETVFSIIDKKHTDARGNNQVLIYSDEANAQHQEFLQELEENAKKGITISTGTEKDFKDNESFAAAYANKTEIKLNPNRFASQERYTEVLGSEHQDDLELAYRHFTAISDVSLISHEKEHAGNYLKGTREDDIHPEYQARLDMMDEISANLTETGLALNYYRTTGRTEGFEGMKNSIGMEGLKQLKDYVTDPKNKDQLDTPSAKKDLGKIVANNWLKEQNQEGSIYSQQIINNSMASLTMPRLRSVSERVYQERVQTMLKDIPVLGDMNGIVNPLFDLNSEIKINTASTDLPAGAEQLLESMSYNENGTPATSMQEAVKNITDHLKNLEKPQNKYTENFAQQTPQNNQSRTDQVVWTAFQNMQNSR